MFNKDLIYICEWVGEWPEEAGHVRLDCDGEVCFDTPWGDFFPEGIYYHEHHPSFIARNIARGTVGYRYTKDEFLACKEYLDKQEAPSNDSTDPVIEKVKIRINEITKRHEQALADELKPLLEVLQRKGEVL